MVWTDDRTAGQYDIYAARVSSSRHVLDPTGIPIATGSVDRSNPAVAFDGTNFLVVWQEGALTFDIKAVRVDQSGTVLDRPAIDVSSAPGTQFYPAVAWSGSSYLVTWSDARSGQSDIYGARVGSDGTVLDQDGLLLWNSPNAAQSPRLAWGGANYLLVWSEFPGAFTENVLAERVDANGVVLDTQPLPIAVGNNDFRSSPSVAVGGALFLVGYEDQNLISEPIRGKRVTADGVILDGGDGIAIGASNTGSAAPIVGWDGKDFVIAWNLYTSSFGNRTSAARVTTDGQVLDQIAIDIAGTGYEPTFAVASDGTDSLIIWADDLYPTDNILGCRLTQDGQVLDGTGFLVSTFPNPTITPAVASNGNGYVVVWEDDRLSPAIYANRVTAGGRPRDGAGIPIDVGTTDQDPAVAWDGANYLIVWTHIGPAGHADIEGARLSPAGVVLDSPAIAISAATADQTSPSVASNGTNFLVAWEDSRNGGADLYGARVSSDGVVLDPGGIAISTAAKAQEQPSVASDGSIYLTVWGDHRNGSSDIYGARVDTNGTVLDPDGIAVSLATADQTTPSLAWNGTDFLLAWADTRQGAGNDIYAARVSSDGVVLDPDGIAVSTFVDDQQDPTVTTTTSGALIVWADHRSGTSWDIVAARVTTDGIVLDVHGAQVSAGDQDETVPSAATALDGETLIAYQRPAPEQPFHGVDRSFIRLFKS